MPLKNRLIEIVYALKDKFSGQTKIVKESIKSVESQSDKTSREIQKDNSLAARSYAKIGAAAAKFGGIITAVYTAIRSTRAVIDVNTDFQRLNASLITVTGSAEKAKDTFKILEDFAAETPYDLNQVVEAFIKLKALGLDPSEDALRSYGNTASAMGKTLNDFIEAVADASTFEFERLKEFGIVARQQGDEVRLTFQGVTTTVKKNATEIEKYLRDIGNITFGDAMERQMDTLGGAFSNLGDEAATLARNIGESGVSAAIQSITERLTSLIEKVNQSIDTLQSYANPEGINAFNLALREEINLTETIIQQTQYLNSLKSDIGRQGVIEGIQRLIDQREQVRKEINDLRESEYIRSKGENQAAEKGKETALAAKETATALQQSVNSIKAIKDEFSNIVSDFSESIGKVDFIDVMKTKLDAESLLDEGDFKGAISKAREAAELLKKLKDQGDDSSVAMGYVAKELQKIAVDAAELDVLVQPRIEINTKELYDAKLEIERWAQTLNPVITPKIVMPDLNVISSDQGGAALIPYIDIELDKRGAL